MGFGRSAAAREKYFGQLRYRLLSAARILAAGIDSGSGRFDVSIEASGRKRGFDSRPFRSERSEEVETRRTGSVSRRYAQAAVCHGSGGVRGNLPTLEAIHGI